LTPSITLDDEIMKTTALMFGKIADDSDLYLIIRKQYSSFQMDEQA